MILLASLLLLSIAVGLWRVLHGPTRADRLLAVQLFSTTGTAILLLLAHGQGQPALIEAALVMALLAAVVSAGLVQLLRRREYE
ncbi:portal protein [Kineobactrum sediminis]|uniref:Portal protein n=1 Tax=Kineobactrum sediminis TaxID=1905677 RepID=A0A2N5Y1K1_9GAMM|nr:monovalent cation/H+ antiporter complex subunit F [Kineobactrum sediminis]PLW82270.1 portal protein [Kineobactrum sediminis]